MTFLFLEGFCMFKSNSLLVTLVSKYGYFRNQAHLSLHMLEILSLILDKLTRRSVATEMLGPLSKGGSSLQ